jgi:hypothetical protein
MRKSESPTNARQLQEEERADTGDLPLRVLTIHVFGHLNIQTFKRLRTHDCRFTIHLFAKGRSPVSAIIFFY